MFERFLSGDTRALCPVDDEQSHEQQRHRDSERARIEGTPDRALAKDRRRSRLQRLYGKILIPRIRLVGILDSADLRWNSMAVRTT